MDPQVITRARWIFVIIMLMISASPSFAQKNNGKAEASIADADTLMNHEDYAGALVIYTKVLEKSKLSSDADYDVLYKRAYAYYGLGKFEEALTDINKFIEKNQMPQGKMLRAYINQELGNSGAQLKDLNEFIAADPDNLELIRWRASVLMETERYTEARKDIRKLLMIDRNPDMKGYLGLSYYYEDKPDSALMVFDEVIASNPKHVQSYLYAASLGLEQEAYDLALQYINKGLAIDPSNHTLMFYKGIALVEEEKKDEGCRCLSKAFAAGVDDAGDYLKGYCYGVE
ncbi:MAG: tetratricopeptide repeat protein [Chryseolinea sp.]